MMWKHLGIGVLALVTTVLAGWRVQSLFGEPALLGPAAAPAQTLSAPPPVDQAIDARSSNWPRSLFRQAAIATAAGPAAVDPHQTSAVALPRLVGVVADGHARLAIVSIRGTLVRLRELNDVEGWTIVRIDPRAAILRRGEKIQLLQLDPGVER